MLTYRNLLTICLFSLSLSINRPAGAQKAPGRSADKIRTQLANEMEHSIKFEMLNKWYPRSIDSVYGGFLSTFTRDFKPTGEQDKMIVTQARHVWSNSVAFQLYPAQSYFKEGARQGFLFLQNKMWDKVNGGFYTLVDREGNPKDSFQKVSYGNAFGIYACARYYRATKDTAALTLAKKCFAWLDDHAHDPVYKGYFQHLDMTGTPVHRGPDVPSTSDLGYKDQNSSIHILEAFTELYEVWPDDLLRQRLEEMLLLIRDVITGPRGNLTLFLTPQWQPVSFRDSSEASILKHHNLDHVSFGHDIETAYLLMEASHALGLQHDSATMVVAKRMVDHCMNNGWDKVRGGFWDEGYYFKDKSKLTIIRDSKNWWAQAEGLNTLLIMADLHPKDPMNYFQKFRQQWRYIQTYLIDHQYGDWFSEGWDTRPESRKGLKGHIWKGNYHQLRSLVNCISRLRNLH